MTKTVRSLLFVFIITSLVLAACSGSASDAPASTEDASAPAAGTMLSGELLGAGASFPAPIYLEWIAEYTSNVQPDVSINYQSIGSGGGVEQFIGQQTDFGGSDAFLTDEEHAANDQMTLCCSRAKTALLILDL